MENIRDIISAHSPKADQSIDSVRDIENEVIASTSEIPDLFF